MPALLLVIGLLLQRDICMLDSPGHLVCEAEESESFAGGRGGNYFLIKALQVLQYGVVMTASIITTLFF